MCRGIASVRNSNSADYHPPKERKACDKLGFTTCICFSDMQNVQVVPLCTASRQDAVGNAADDRLRRGPGTARSFVGTRHGGFQHKFKHQNKYVEALQHGPMAGMLAWDLQKSLKLMFACLCQLLTRTKPANPKRQACASASPFYGRVTEILVLMDVFKRCYLMTLPKLDVMATDLCDIPFLQEYVQQS